MLAGFGVIAAVLWLAPWVGEWNTAALAWSGSGAQITAVGLATLGAIFFALSRGAPAIAKPVYVAWMSIALLIGLVMSTILLTVLFLVLLPVFSIVVRAADPLRRRLKIDGSYWEDYKPHESTLERMRRPF